LSRLHPEDQAEKKRNRRGDRYGTNNIAAPVNVDAHTGDHDEQWNDC